MTKCKLQCLPDLRNSVLTNHLGLMDRVVTTNCFSLSLSHTKHTQEGTREEISLRPAAVYWF